MGPTDAMVKEFSERRRMVMQMLAEIPNIRIDEPAGAFYVFPDVSYYFGKKDGDSVIPNADALCMYLLEKAHVSTVTGGAFGEPNCIRISYAASREDIQKGFSRIREALLRLQ
jgi:aspartate aminotransferase